jgi:solute carrier family 25 iron transporter 28/37
MFVGCVPAHALYFSSFEASKKMFGADKEGHHPAAAAASGAIATFMHDSVMTPVDTVKQRLQLGYHAGMLDCVKSMFKNEGIGAFYRSWHTTVGMNIPYGCVMVATNESLKKFLNARSGVGEGKEKKFSVLNSMLAGSGSGALAAAATCPLDVIKTRLQTQNLTPIVAFTPPLTNSTGGSTVAASRGFSTNTVGMSMSTSSRAASAGAGHSAKAEVALQYNGFMDAYKAIIAEEGTAGLFRGIIPRLLTHAPAVAISWTTYEGVKRWLEDDF